MAAKKKRRERLAESAPSQPFAGENVAKQWAAKAAAERALHEYLALPDASAIANHTLRASSTSGGLTLIRDAEKEARRIRMDMVRSWDGPMTGTVWALLETKIGKLPEGSRRIHPVIGPLLDVYYDELIPKHQAEVRPAVAAWEAQDLAARNEAQTARKKMQDAKAIAATKSREGALMVRCVKDYVEWAQTEKKPISLNSADEFGTTERIKNKRIKKERLAEFLRTLITGMNNSRSDEVICGILNDCKTMRRKRPKRKTWGDEEPKEVPEMHFGNVTLPAVTECMKILRRSNPEKTRLDKIG